MLGLGRTNRNGSERSARVARLIGQCARLLADRGHAVSHQLAREVLDGYAELVVRKHSVRRRVLELMCQNKHSRA
jgi:hypothetical protein